MTMVSNFMIPGVIFLVVGFGISAKIKTYECFLKGAKEGLQVVVEILPTLVGLMAGVGILRASGFFEVLGNLLNPVMKNIGLPGELLPLLIVKLFSASAATGLVLDIFKNLGPDSYGGLVTSLVMSCTETVFYTMSVYFLAAKVTKTGYTLKGALLSTLAGTIAAVVMAGWMTGSGI